MQSVDIANLYQKIYEVLSGTGLSSGDSLSTRFFSFLSFITPVSIALSLLFLTGIIYCTIRLYAIAHEEEEKYRQATAHSFHNSLGEAMAHGGDAETPAAIHGGNKRWQKIIDHVNSDSESDWRLAILECDIILDEMLTKMSYHGDTLGDKLKAVEKSDFLSIDKAWEAHKIRNDIAHRGGDFQITDREVRRVVALYEEVFKEFHYI